MQFKPPRKKRETETVLPLINLVFLLLIFFLMVGQLSATDPFRVDPARSTSGDTAARSEMLILVGFDGQLAIDGEITDDASLAGRVRDRMAEDPSGQTRVDVRLKADARTEATRVVDIMRALRDAGVDQVQLLTVPNRQ